MKNRRSNTFKAQLALTGGLVLLFAGCQTLTPNKATVDTEGTVGSGKVVGQKGGTAGQAGGGAATATANFDSKVTGTVVDANGKPLAGVQVNSFDGAKAVTGADGSFSLDVVGQDDLVVDFSVSGYLPRQMVTGVAAGATAELKAVLKPLDPNVVQVQAGKAATITSSDGQSILDIPEGALAANGAVRVTWMDPMPSNAFPESYGQLPGPLTTQAKDGPPLSLAPLGFSNIDFLNGAMLKPGAQATLKMKVNPDALTMAQKLNMPVDFNNPTTLQQPCYEYDRATGLWVNPATSKLEKDAQGNVWFIYTVHGAQAPANYTILQESTSGGGFVTGQKTVRVPRTETTYNVMIGGSVGASFTSRAALDAYCARRGCGRVETSSRTVYVDKIEDIFGKYLNGSVHEKSSNAQFNGAGLGGATVYHAADWFRGTTKGTNGAGQFSIPVSHTLNSLPVSGSSWRGANSTGGGYTMQIPTDGSVHANVQGGAITLAVSGPGGSTLVGGNSFSGDDTKTASRDTVVTVNNPAAPAYLSGGNRQATVPVAGRADLGTIKVLHDATGKVIEHTTATPDNDKTDHPHDGDGLVNATVNFGSADALTGRATTASGTGGAFKFTFLNNQAFPGTVSATYDSLSATSTGSYKLEFYTDSTVTLNMKGVFNSDAVGPATVTYKVDGVQYTKNVTLGADGVIKLTFSRDRSDDNLKFELVGLEAGNMVANKPFPTATLSPGDAASKDVDLVFKADAVKYRQ